jgi:hypothetical protein
LIYGGDEGGKDKTQFKNSAKNTKQTGGNKLIDFSERNKSHSN